MESDSTYNMLCFSKGLLCHIHPFPHARSQITHLRSLYWLDIAFTRSLPVRSTFATSRDAHYHPNSTTTCRTQITQVAPLGIIPIPHPFPYPHPCPSNSTVSSTKSLALAPCGFFGQGNIDKSGGVPVPSLHLTRQHIFITGVGFLSQSTIKVRLDPKTKGTAKPVL